MVDDRSIARQKLEGPDREILFVAQRKDHVAVEILAVSSQLRGALLLEHDIGRPEVFLEGSVVGQRRELGRLRRIAGRHVGLHPLPQHRQLLGRRRFVAQQNKITFHLSRWHPLGLDFLDCLLHPIDGVVVGGERERPGLAGAVAPLALVVQKGQHVFGIRNFVVGSRRGRGHLRSVERAADRFGDGEFHLATGEQIDDRVLEIRLRDAGRLLAPHLVAIVDAALIPRAATGVDQHNFRRGRGIECLGKAEVAVGDEREVNRILIAVSGDLLRLIKLADHAHEADALLVKLRGQFGEHRSVPLSQRAGGVEERVADGLPIAAEQVGECHVLPVERLGCGDRRGRIAGYMARGV